jgi:nicotinate-nucleotide adenylyltransferase
MKTGIFGGTFNPVHLGHLAVCEAARAAHELDRVFLVPSGSPPHKLDERGLAPGDQRLEMVRIAVEGRDLLEPSAIELERPGASYMVDTLELFERRYPEDELFLVVGGDTVGELATWYSWRRLFELSRIVAVNRPGFDPDFLDARFDDLSDEIRRRCVADMVEMDEIDISSTRIRQAAASGEDLSSWVPAGVGGYIHEHGLYSP